MNDDLDIGSAVSAVLMCVCVVVGLVLWLLPIVLFWRPMMGIFKVATG